MPGRRLSLLVLPGNFPQDDVDIRGVFILDYVRAVRDFCDATVLDYRLSGKHTTLKEDSIAGIRVLRLAVTRRVPHGVAKIFNYIVWFFRGWKLARKLGPADIIHVHGSTLAGNLALLIRRRLQCPVVLTHHSGPFDKVIRGRLNRWLTKHAFENCDMVLYISRHLERDVQAAGIRPAQSEVVGNPVDTELFDIPASGDARESTQIVFVGRLEPYKGALRSVRAFQKISTDYPDWRLVIVGDGPEFDQIRSYMAQHKVLASQVTLAGRLSKARIAEEFKRSAFLVAPSEHETFGLVAAEAMAAGLPVIVGNQTASVEYVDDDSGLKVAADDISGIASAMRHMIDRRSDYQPWTIRKRIVDRYGLKAYGVRLEHIYRTLV